MRRPRGFCLAVPGIVSGLHYHERNGDLSFVDIDLSHGCAKAYAGMAEASIFDGAWIDTMPSPDDPIFLPAGEILLVWVSNLDCLAGKTHPSCAAPTQFLSWCHRSDACRFGRSEKLADFHAKPSFKNRWPR